MSKSARDSPHPPPAGDGDAALQPRGTGPRPTRRDVAALAKVHPSLVSRVANGDRRIAISEATRERVLAAIEELGYRPNIYARGLRMARAWTIGLVLPSLANPGYAVMVDSAQRRAQELGYAVIISSTLDQPTVDESLSRLLAERRFDGLLVASTPLTDAAIRGMASGQTPVVAVNRRVEGVESLFLDDALGIRVATEHLIGLGHDSLALIGVRPTLDASLRRREGFEQAVSAAGVRGSVVTGAEIDARAGFLATKRLLDDDPTITGVVAAGVLVAIGAIRAAGALGLRVPADLSVIALHDWPLAEFTEPPLSTVAMPVAELGVRAVDALVAAIEQRDLEAGMLPTEPRLIARDSTGPPPQNARANDAV